MDKHDKLAKQMLESSESLSVRRNLPELAPLEQLLAKVQVRWPYPEMGDMEYLDWRETLSNQPLQQVIAALDRLMKSPPKRELPDGTIQEYTGRPNLVDVLRTIERMAGERAQEKRRDEGEQLAAQMRELQKRKDAGEEFFGLADVLKAKRITESKKVAKPMPNVKTQWPDIDPDRNKAKLEQQKKDLGLS